MSIFTHEFENSKVKERVKRKYIMTENHDYVLCITVGEMVHDYFAFDICPKGQNNRDKKTRYKE